MIERGSVIIIMLILLLIIIIHAKIKVTLQGHCTNSNVTYVCSHSNSNNWQSLSYIIGFSASHKLERWYYADDISLIKLLSINYWSWFLCELRGSHVVLRILLIVVQVLDYEMNFNKFSCLHCDICARLAMNLDKFGSSQELVRTLSRVIFSLFIRVALPALL